MPTFKATASFATATATYTSSVAIPSYAKYFAVRMPDTQTADVNTLYFSDDNSTFVPVLDPVDGAAYVLKATSSASCFTDFSNVISSNFWSYASDRKMYLKMRRSNSATASATSAYFYFSD